ncbi:endonuclease domain-containing protein [Methylobacterium sp. J-068]|uniref:endonuclease domain-containing protein n=1 Tax=Methylobacterium sp. J-068 TaxID=2836649 RepID=UPI001FBAE137|nr:endonuclease domain-containing protein [Methylobacterium sp. J-068]MCJ2035038.1 endonuclease domain-containing protein [Methylobacterium sp. J-068]
MDQPPKLNDVSPRLRTFAREQRRLVTRAEALFWEQVRGGRCNRHKFRRQVPIAPYIVDFLCPSARLIVELDGEPHETEERKIRDAKRDAWLTAQGFQILRFPNDCVLDNLPAVMSQVEQAIDGRRCPSPASLREAPSPAEGGGLDTKQVHA